MGAFYANDPSAVPQVQDFVKWNLDIVAWWWAWVTIDYTKSHEEILKKYDKIREKDLQTIIKSIPEPKMDMTKFNDFIEMLRKKEEDEAEMDISSFLDWITDIKNFIDTLAKNISEKYAKEAEEMKLKHGEEIAKKNSLLKENEYTLLESKKYISLLKETITKLEKRVKEVEDEKEDELKEMEEGYKVAIKQEKERTETETKDKIRKDILSSIE